MPLTSNAGVSAVRHTFASKNRPVSEPGVTGEAVGILFRDCIRDLFCGRSYPSALEAFATRPRMDLYTRVHDRYFTVMLHIAIIAFPNSTPKLYFVFTKKTDDVEWTFQPMRAAETQPNAYPRGIASRIRRVTPKLRMSTDS
ncbi:hypothetical protein BCON_0020g00490 [Botryotinia convoluta]|uniref:Uncharacterized protein n=1 Tax=Botryotinia convoluta TaxID=54673 RepID=A0A4Z1ILU5_9HELO|nr:hypothetical protein BCON_0020g00490 [Botryotinia convoluta]